MSPLTRRAALRAIGFGSTAPAFVIAGASAATTENPDLQRIVREIAETAGAIDAALVEKEAARTRYAAIEPKAPAELVVRKYADSNHGLRNVSDAERDCFGDMVRREVPRDERNIVCAYSFARQYLKEIAPQIGRPTPCQVEARAFYQRILAYEADVKAAREQAGCDTALYAVSRLDRRMHDLVEKLPTVPARTGAGLVAKVRAYDCHRRCRQRIEGYLGRVDHDAAKDLGANIIAMFGEGSLS